MRGCCRHAIGSVPVIWRSQVESSVWTLLVEVADVDDEDALELAAPEHEEAIEAFPARAADEAFGVGVRVRRLDRRSDDLDAFTAEDGVEGAAKFRITIVNQKTQPPAMIIEIHQQVVCLLDDPDHVRHTRTDNIFNP